MKITYSKLIFGGDGSCCFLLMDNFHRDEEDGFADFHIVNGSVKMSYIHHNKCHRLGGPAVEFGDGLKYWYYHDKYIKCSSQEEFEKIIKLIHFQ